MRFTPPALALTLLVTACNTGDRYNQGDDFALDDTGDSGSTTSDGGSSGDGGGDGGDTDGGGTDGGGTDGGGSDGGGGDGGGPDYCHNDYDPLHETGWTKTFTATFSVLGDASATGTATESGLGMTTLPDGTEGYAYTDSITGTNETFDVTTYVACDPGSDEGMFVVGWAGLYSAYGFVTMDIDASLEPGRPYLPPQYALGSVGSWDYAYNLYVDTTDPSTGTPTSYLTQTSGTYNEAGFQDITLFNGETVSAYKVVNTYTQVSDLGTVNGYIESYWVKGLGLVKEVHLNMDTGATIASKDLTSYTGLTID